MTIKTIENKSGDGLNAAHLTAAAVGILCGLSGLEHGFFETLQGSLKPDALLINAIGSANRFWVGGTEPALTIIPNFLITGILAMFFSLLVILWSARFMQHKYGAAIFFLLSLMQFLTGGGFAQIFLVLMVTAAAAQINTRLTWVRTLMPSGVRRLLAKTWLWLLLAFVFTITGAMIAAVFGYFPLISNLFNLYGQNLRSFLVSSGYFMLVLLPLTILAGLAHDFEQKPTTLPEKDEFK